MRIKCFLLIILFFILFPAAKNTQATETVTVFAAASLTGPLTEIIHAFEENTVSAVKANFSSSGTLARQLEQGAIADIYISASQKWMDYAQDNASIIAATRINPIGNSIVLISPKGSPAMNIRFDQDFSLAQSFEGKFSIGDPAHVPAGKYAKESMEKFGWWTDMEPRLILAKDVRQALMIVESGEVALGTVFGSDAASSDKVMVQRIFPPETHTPVIYSAAACAASADPAAGEKFLEYLMSKKAQEIFLKYGFIQVK